MPCLQQFNRRSVMLSVKELLGTVDLEGLIRGVPNDITHSRKVRIFCSYSHKDELLREELETQLKVLENKGLISHWHDRQITPGAEWADEIDENLENADIVLLMVSADFIASDYCYKIEMKRALERAEKGDARVVPVIVRDVDWTDTPIGHFQALPTNGNAVTLWKNKDSAWRNVSEGLEKLVREIRATKFV